jgi:hypothetical protein
VIPYVIRLDVLNDWRRLEDDDLVVVCGRDLSAVDGASDADDLHIVVADARDDLDAVKGGREDDEVAAGSVRGEGDAIDAADAESAVAAVGRARQDLVTLHRGTGDRSRKIK